MFAIGVDTFLRKEIGVNITDFVKLKQSGKINLYIHYTPIQIVPIDKVFRFDSGFATKGDTGKRSEYGHLTRKRYFRLYMMFTVSV